jgi:hypothetical protein
MKDKRGIMNRRLFVLAAFLFVAGCKTVTAYGEFHTLSATVKHSDLEGGFFYLHGDDGVDYDPINLATEYRVDGKRVKVKLKVRDDLANTHMFGIIVEIVDISALP